MFLHIQIVMYILPSCVFCQKEINTTVINGNNVTLLKPDNASFQLQQWFFKPHIKDGCDNTQLCDQFPNDIHTHNPYPPYCMPLKFMCNGTSLYLHNVRPTAPVQYFLVQQGGVSTLPYRNITYNILFYIPPHSSSVTHSHPVTPHTFQQQYVSISLTAISQTYTNNHIYIVIVLIFIVTIFCIGLGYLHYRKPLQKRFRRL
ncbi:Ja08.1 [Japanese cytomegalovirus]|nr:Ja08.1 [Japanese cytomegalovirus]